MNVHVINVCFRTSEGGGVVGTECAVGGGEAPVNCHTLKNCKCHVADRLYSYIINKE